MIKSIITVFVLLCCVQADTIHFKNGATLTGAIESQDEQTLTVNGTTYSMSDIKSVSKTTSAPPPPAPAPESTQSSDDAATTNAPKQRLIGPAGLTGVVRRSHRRQDRRGPSID
jgi:hypothetical protein